MATLERPASPPEGLHQDEVATLLAAATAAPSVHNSQPWRFAVAGDEVRLHLDRSRTLPVADPAGREAVISCGAALESLALAMGHLGYAAEVTLQPGPGEPDHLATVRRGPAQEPDRQAEAWYAAVRRRRMHRRPFAHYPVAGSRVAELRQVARHGPVWCRVVTGPEQRWLLGEVAAQAAGELLGNPAYRAELAGWTRRHQRRSGDGIPLAAVGEQPYPESGLPWGLYNEPSVDDEAFQRDVFLVVGTGQDGVREWLEAGRALMRVLLHATSRGLATSLLTQALELANAREVLVEGLALPGQPQVLLRVGYPLEQPSRTPRRPVSEVLET
jgi:nitroreductase